MAERSNNPVTTDSDRDNLRREQIDSVFRKLRLILGVDAVSGSMLTAFALVFAETLHPGTYLWVGALFLSSGIFYLLGRSQIGIPSDVHNILFRKRFLFVMAFLSGVIWGSTWLLAPVSAEQMVLAPKGATIIWFCLMLANATIVLSVNWRLFLSFAVPAVSMHIAFSLYMGSRQDLQIAGALVVILGFSTFMAVRIGKELNDTIRLRLQNRGLNLKLSQDEEMLLQREAELTMRIDREEALLRSKRDADNRLAMAAREKLLLLDAVSEGIFGINNLGNISFVNATALQLLNLEESEVIGQGAMDILLRSSTETGKEAATRKSLNLCLFKSESVQSVDGLFCGKGDLILPVRFSCRPIVENGELFGAVVSFVDMTKQLELESKLVQAEKMEAIGRITGGVAHDFNNLLTVIMGNLQLLRRRLGKDESADELRLVDNLLKATNNGAEMNRRLLSFTREQPLNSKAEDIGSVLAEMKSFILGALGEDIELSLELDEDDTTAKIDRTQFENVIVNLCVNARDAMPGGGRLEIAVRRVRADGPDDTHRQHEDERDLVEITVSDNGPGIPEEIQSKVFDPFFTTKEMGAGSGFGLSTAFGFMQQSGGSIRVKSQPGEGTTFTLQLPHTSERSESSRAKADTEAPAAERYSGTILLVEDDSGVRDIATQMLLAAGFQVIAANDGNSGLERFNNNPNIDLVFSDIMMPGGMNGIDMAKHILEAKPSTPVLLATGYTKESLRDRLEESDSVIYISKPYNTDKLPELIHSMLARA